MGFLSVVLLCGGLVQAALAEPLMETDPVYQGAAVRQLIPYRDGMLLENEGLGADFVEFARFDKRTTSVVSIDGIALLFDAERGSNGVLFLGLDEKKIVVVEEGAEGVQRQLSVPDAFHPQFVEDLQPGNRPKLIASTHRVAAIVGDVVWWFDGDWHHRKVPRAPRVSRQRSPEISDLVHADCHYLKGTTLYSGWNQGEWGGMLASIDLSNPAAGWVRLSSKKRGDSSGISRRMPVGSIHADKSGHLWVATGNSNCYDRGLYCLHPSGSWKTLVDGDGPDDRGELKLPAPASIQASTADDNGRIFVLSEELGVLRLAKEGFESLVNPRFYQYSSERDGYSHYCVSLGVGVSKRGDLYISTNAFGVFAFRQTNGEWSGRQITFHKEDGKRLESRHIPPSKPKEDTKNPPPR